MSDHPPVIFVDLIRKPGALFGKRPQRWRWVAKSGGNFRTLAVSGESFTNRQDCLDSITRLFGVGSTVYLRQAEQGNELLRRAVQ